MGVLTAEYGELLSIHKPHVIRTAADHRRAMALMEEIDFKKNATAEEKELAELLSRLVEDYESRTVTVPDASPHRVLQYLMERHGMRQADLVPLIGSRPLTSQIVTGKREISKALAKKLAERFHVNPEVLLY